MSKDDYPPVVQGVHASEKTPMYLKLAKAIVGDASSSTNEFILAELVINQHEEIEYLESDGQNLRALISQFDAAIRRIAAELTDQACGGVDTGNEINPETGEPYGRGGHTGWLLAREARKLREANTRKSYE